MQNLGVEHGARAQPQIDTNEDAKTFTFRSQGAFHIVTDQNWSCLQINFHLL